MTTLVARYDTEVQWHGQVRRLSDFEFEIFDIIVPPHEVSGTTVTSEYRPYCEWLNGLDDETFTTVKFHGHSHVNMSVSPSGTDTKYRLDLVTQLPKPTDVNDVFYIFFIVNKKHEWSAEIYDFTNDALYSSDEIVLETVFDDYGEDTLEGFIANAKKVAVSRKYYSGYNSTGYSGYKGHTANAGKEKGNEKPVLTDKKGDKKGAKKGGAYWGYDTLEEYYDAIFDNSRTYVDEHPSDPFYANDWGCT